MINEQPLSCGTADLVTSVVIELQLCQGTDCAYKCVSIIMAIRPHWKKFEVLVTCPKFIVRLFVFQIFL